MSYAIGVDTGGTYTDAVIIDQTSDKVVATAKAVTTHGALSEGISAALQSVLNGAPDLPRDAISQVCLSTTLATNALVEGRGSSIAVVLIGFDEAMIERTCIATAIPDAHLIIVNGGHRYDGAEVVALDTHTLTEQIVKAAQHVDAFAIASHYSVRNPNHERTAEQIVRQKTNKPVSASCDLSDSLDGPKRALTAAFNARIISLIVDLQRAVQRSLDQLNIQAPVMIVKGDGSIAQADTVLNKPIETILSGPAASVIGARFLSKLSDFVISDIGGTTTDVATVINGWPATNDKGADIGGYRTLVKAIDMRTLGLGGDSAIEMDDSNQVVLRHHRVMPIAMLGHLWPHIEHELTAALTASSGMRAALCYLIRTLPAATKDRPNPVEQLSVKDQNFLAKLPADRPCLLNDVVSGAAQRSSVKRLIDRGFLRQSGYTPSDAAHVLNLQNQWSRTAAVAATELLGRAHYRVTTDQVEHQINVIAEDVIELVIAKSTRLLIEQLSGQDFSIKDSIVNASTRQHTHLKHLQVNLSAALPIVAVGGPAAVFYPRIGQRLSTEAIIPAHSEVANAIGAAVGRIRATATVEVTSKESGGYWIHGSSSPYSLDNGAEAIQKAMHLAREMVSHDMAQKGGQAINIHVDIDRVIIPDTEDDKGLISARIVASCDSVPRVN